MTPQDPAQGAKEKPKGRRMGPALKTLAALITTALTIVIVAPIALSSQDLVRWAMAPTGLGLPEAWAWLAFVALDAAAAVCVGMVSVAAWRGEPGGAFHVLTWAFALGSATANYRHGQVTPARDDEYFFPAMSLAGPLLLDVTLARVRRWARLEARTQLSARPRFGLRWLPGVGFRSTLRAWQAALREDIAEPAEALTYTREVAALRDVTPADALRFAWQALGDTDPYAAWQWLVARGVHIDQRTITEAAETVTLAPVVTAWVTADAPPRVTPEVTAAPSLQGPADVTQVTAMHHAVDGPETVQSDGACSTPSDATEGPEDGTSGAPDGGTSVVQSDADDDPEPVTPVTLTSVTGGGARRRAARGASAPRAPRSRQVSARKAAPRAPSTRERIVELHEAEPDLSGAEIARRLGMTRQTVNRYLKTQAG